MLFFCGLVIKYVEIGLGVLRQREDFKGRLQAAKTLTALMCCSFETVKRSSADQISVPGQFNSLCLFPPPLWPYFKMALNWVFGGE